MTFATQKGDKNETTVANNGTEWVINLKGSGTRNSFTRFAVGTDEGAYVGRFLLIFDVSCAEDNIEISRLGARVVDEGANDIFKDNQSKLIGTHSNEENNSSRKFEANTKYRFIYVMETTAENQMIQMYVCAQQSSITLSNLHFIPLDDKVNDADGKLMYFGPATDSIVSLEACAHEWTHDGYCYRCGEEV
jgi:hypothetical protein